ncbi:carboxypeptidase-like regulatory domain-containing protein [Polaribacter sargassicola]|uniref:carboxypeptidase-like regulatory domain-containing protein n=1 Tax=Polaribacter sargassicola TaxID=2836891 RepID=UPI001F242A01|nr:carboxypeptidase-like regulatory domain-containing protein [Polaribacter sp. DS7-9]MCG1037569.1 carboxypeptidase-like regulatory domain-containing protein [Polaribacter sp. DS7-9]
MKNRFLLLVLFISYSIFSQKTIEGTVYENNTPIENVAIYLNNTMLGTTTNANGKFSLSVEEGKYELIVSYLGFKKINYSLNTSSYLQPLIFKLQEDENILDEIIIKKTVYNDEWKYNLAAFKRDFIGITELAKDCELLNPEVLHFNYNAKENILTALARKPLRLKHKGLGYLITYELENFERNKNYVSYLGYSRYEQLKGGKRKQKHWNENREKAYNGSTIHFFKSLLNNTFTEEGFIVNQFKRVLNPERPSDSEIKKAREIIKLSRGLNINFSKEIDEPKNAIDSALVTIKKSRLEKFNDYLYKSKLSQKDIITIKNRIAYLTFDDNLSIVYTKEKEEMGYLTRNAFQKLREPLPQTSNLIPLKEGIIVDKNGLLIYPLDVLFENYWSYYEKIATYLPLDYKPNTDN